MNNKKCFSLLCVAMTLLFMSASMSYSAAKSTLRKNTSVRPRSSAKGVNMPDLIIKQVAWSSTPKAGDTVGASAILSIIVQNRGNAPAGEHKLKIDCKSLTGTNYPYPLNGMISVQPLGPGQSMGYSWPPMSSEKWTAGTYQLDFTADYNFNLVAESNENNNKKSLIFTVPAKTDFKAKLKMKSVMKPQLKADIEVVSVSMNPVNPVSGQTVSVMAVVRNSGKIKTPTIDSLVTFWNTKGGSNFYAVTPSVPPLLPGQTYELKTTTPIITLGPSAGVSVKLDRFNQYKEINETNNQKTLFFTIQCKPELAAYDYTKPKPASITGTAKPGEPLSTTIWIYNNGGCQSKPATLVVQGMGLTPTSYPIPAIMGNQKVGIPVSLTWAQAGIKNCELIVDYTNTNDESIENNNRLPFIVSVLGEWPATE